MSTLTTNYKLVKPDLTDPADITAMNDNWDKIDANLKSLKDASDKATEDINTEVGKLQTKITYGTSEPSGGKSGDVYIQIIEE